MRTSKTEYRLYPDGSVIHEDEFPELDLSGSMSDDYKTFEIPDDIIDYIQETFCIGCRLRQDQ